MKYGTVLLIGRPNVGKSTFLNNLIGQKVAITSPKPQTTRFPIQAVYQTEDGQIEFIDTPGVFGRAQDQLSKKINERTYEALGKEVDVVLYMIDHTRRRDYEESKVLGMVRKLTDQGIPTYLVINKIDLQEKTYANQYRFLEEEVDGVFAISALEGKHFGPLIDTVLTHMHEPSQIADSSDRARTSDPDPVYPIQNIDSMLFVSELIREKIFLHTGKEVPYSATVMIDEITERENGTMYIKARIVTTADRYKKMLIGKGGEKIKDLGRLARKEIELAINKNVYLDLTVETDPHWQESYFG